MNTKSETWDDLETAISRVECMVELLILATEHPDSANAKCAASFALFDIEARAAVAKELYYKLHAEVRRGDRKPKPVPVEDDESDESNVIPLH